jgi:hypothetical protein
LETGLETVSREYLAIYNILLYPILTSSNLFICHHKYYSPLQPHQITASYHTVFDSKMRLYGILLLVSASFTAGRAVMDIEPRTNNGNNGGLNSDRCLLYKPPQWDNTRNQCLNYCKGKGSSYGCLADVKDGKITYSKAPGTFDTVAPGTCHCDFPIINYLAQTVLEALPAIAAVSD